MPKLPLKPELKLGADRKRVMWLGGLLAVLAIVWWLNRSDTPAATASSAPRPSPSAAVPAPVQRPKAPLTRPRSPNATQPGGVESYWWGSILTGARKYPVVLDRPHRLVYSAHDWGPWKWNMPWYRHMTYAGVTSVWHQHWTLLLDHPDASYAAPRCG